MKCDLQSALCNYTSVIGLAGTNAILPTHAIMSEAFGPHCQELIVNDNDEGAVFTCVPSMVQYRQWCTVNGVLSML